MKKPKKIQPGRSDRRIDDPSTYEFKISRREWEPSQSECQAVKLRTRGMSITKIWHATRLRADTLKRLLGLTPEEYAEAVLLDAKRNTVL